MAEPEQRTTFADATGDKWTLAINYAQVIKLADQHGFDIRKSLQDSFAALGEVVENDERLVGVLNFLLAKQMAEKSLSADQFAERLDGPTLEAAGVSLARAVFDFFREPQRSLGHAALDKGIRTLPKMQSAAVAAIDALPDDFVGRASTGLSGEAQASSASTPASSA